MDHPASATGSGARYRSFAEFYPFYLGEHAHPVSRRLHVVGTAGTIALLVAALWGRDWRLGALVPVCGYAFAWAGHFFFEKNRPATFTYPLWSLMGDFRMFFEIVSGRRGW